MDFNTENELSNLLDEARTEIRTLGDVINYLNKQLSFTGLTTNELQSIHNLIKGQTNLIMSLQDKGDVSNSTSAINSLAKLVSLVSKPTD